MNIDEFIHILESLKFRVDLRVTYERVNDSVMSSDVAMEEFSRRIYKVEVYEPPRNKNEPKGYNYFRSIAYAKSYKGLDDLLSNLMRRIEEVDRDRKRAAESLDIIVALKEV